MPTPTFSGVLHGSVATGMQTISVAVNASSSGDNTIVSAAPGYVIIVTSYKIVCAGDVTVTWKSSGGRVLDGPCAFAQNGGESTPSDPNGHFFTDLGEALLMNLSGAIQVGGHVVYSLVTRKT